MSGIRFINVKDSYVYNAFHMAPVETWIHVTGEDTEGVHIQPEKDIPFDFDSNKELERQIDRHKEYAEQRNQEKRV